MTSLISLYAPLRVIDADSPFHRVSKTRWASTLAFLVATSAGRDVGPPPHSYVQPGAWHRSFVPYRDDSGNIFTPWTGHLANFIPHPQPTL